MAKRNQNLFLRKQENRTAENQAKYQKEHALTPQQEQVKKAMEAPVYKRDVPGDGETLKPSFAPTARPSWFQTLFPSVRPSGHPSGRPSSEPSSNPSTQPSRHPSAQPSSRPSATRQPSAQPSIVSTLINSLKPTVFLNGSIPCPPVYNRTIIGYENGTNFDDIFSNSTIGNSTLGNSTLGNSTFPSVRPSGHPSGRPSSEPSSNPSTQPSRHPSAQPSSRPSATRQPSAQPSIVSTLTNSLKPTVFLNGSIPCPPGYNRTIIGYENGTIGNSTLGNSTFVNSTNGSIPIYGNCSLIQQPDNSRSNQAAANLLPLYVVAGIVGACIVGAICFCLGRSPEKKNKRGAVVPDPTILNRKSVIKSEEKKPPAVLYDSSDSEEEEIDKKQVNSAQLFDVEDIEIELGESRKKAKKQPRANKRGGGGQGFF